VRHHRHAMGTADTGRRSFVPALGAGVLTPLYDLTAGLLGFGRSFRAGVARLADVRAGESVLDLGCGTGTLLAALLAARPEAVYAGVDPDPRVLAAARRRLAGRDVELIEGYAEDLPFASQRFDVVVSTLAFHHIPDGAKRTAVREVRRVLRPSGRFLLVDLGPPRSLVGRAVLHLASLVHSRGNMRPNLAGELPTMLAEAGFDVREVRPPHRGARFLLVRPTLA
jgi:ubiquinone/menaquinone biosynthesis C-methylase UbiE